MAEYVDKAGITVCLNKLKDYIDTTAENADTAISDYCSPTCSFRTLTKGSTFNFKSGIYFICDANCTKTYPNLSEVTHVIISEGYVDNANMVNHSTGNILFTITASSNHYVLTAKSDIYITNITNFTGLGY